jgi:hypothetical protein
MGSCRSADTPQHPAHRGGAGERHREIAPCLRCCGCGLAAQRFPEQSHVSGVVQPLAGLAAGGREAGQQAATAWGQGSKCCKGKLHSQLIFTAALPLPPEEKKSCCVHAQAHTQVDAAHKPA